MPPERFRPAANEAASAAPAAPPTARRTFVVVCQVYPPDPAAVGQHVADAAAELVRRGHRVVVFTARRGYDDPSAVHPRREVRDGVEVRRLSFSSFGKGSMAARLLGGLLFSAQALVRGLFVRGVDRVVVSTVPPFGPVFGAALSWARRAPLAFWVMDLNPDQAVALGKARPGSPAVRLMEWANRAVLGRASRVIVLDRAMAERVNARRNVSAKLAVVPPWAPEGHLAPVAHEDNPFRRRHGLEGKRVVMYSGNHGPSNPLSTLLEAARRVVDLPGLAFVFAGGGVGKGEVEACGLASVLSLPYQPLEELRWSLSAADVHAVTMGDAMVGIVHPCKVYGAMAVARPLLAIAPADSHLGEIVDGGGVGWRVAHGDVDAAEAALREIAAAPPERLADMGRRARELLEARYAKDALCGAVADLLEGA